MTNNNLVKLRTSNRRRVTLVWLAHAGGSASFFQDISRLLPEEIDCQAFEYPGRGRRMREDPVAELALLARDLATSLEALGNTPYILFGHSLGARVAYETGRRLKLQCKASQPALILASASESPSSARRNRALHKLPDDKLIEAIFNMGGTPRDELSEEILSLYLPVIRADLTAAETHRGSYEPPLSQPIKVYTGRDDQLVQISLLTRWNDVTISGATIRIFNGGHFYMLEDTVRFRDAIAEDVLALFP